MEDDKFYELVEIYRDPAHYGKPEIFNYKEEGFSSSCGDKFILYLNIDGGTVKDAGFEGKGCVISTVSISKLCDEMIGKSIKEVDKMNLDTIKQLLGLDNISISRIKCATVGLEAAQKISKNSSSSD